MKKINLFNRDKANLNLVSEDGKIWAFEVDKPHEFVLEYMRVGYRENKESIEFIDPSGGPFISVGNKLSDNLVVKEIVWNDKTPGFNIITEELCG